MIHLTTALCALALYAADLEIEIEVSPRILNLATKGEVVTVHTSIDYSLVDPESVTLNDVPIDWWKMDDCGNFVAKFSMDDIKNLPLKVDAYNTFELTGATESGEPFAGSSDVLVIRKGK